MTKPIIIIEGADCAGKTTLVNALKETIPAHVVHFSNLKRVKKSLARMYVEAAMPAVLGHMPVIFDRCWLSELPYGKVFRPDQPLRVDTADIRMLERLFLSCEAFTVYCDPGASKATEVFKSRAGEEYLDNVMQLLAVRDLYPKSLAQSHLPWERFNWMEEDLDSYVKTLATRVLLLEPTIEHIGHHGFPGAGSVGAKVMIVGDEFAEHQEYDPHFQWPFASFSHSGCSRWLATQLDCYKIREEDLWWVNQDQLDTHNLNTMINLMPRLKRIIGAGGKAIDKLNSLASVVGHYDHIALSAQYHPQFWKRFYQSEEYPLMRKLKELLA